MRVAKEHGKEKGKAIEVASDSWTIEQEEEVETPLLAHLHHRGKTVLRTKQTRKVGLSKRGVSWRGPKDVKKSEK